MIEDLLEKTEPPSQRKLEEARRKGIVATSDDLTISGILLASSLFFFFFIKEIVLEISSLFLAVIANLNYPYDDFHIVSYWAKYGFTKLGMILLIPFIGIFTVGILIGLLQTGFNISFFSIKPNYKKINLFDGSNYSKYFNLSKVVKTVFGQLKIVLVIFLCWKVIEIDMFQVFSVSRIEISSLVMYLFKRMFFLAFVLSCGYLILGFLDFAFQKWNFMREMKMSTRELRDEIKEAEGSMQSKSKIRYARQRLSVNSLVTIVPKATVVITGNFHAIALQYHSNKMLAPVCLALGFLRKAEMIKKIALQHQVHIVENPLLADSLFKGLKEGSAVPSHLYKEVAFLFVKSVHK